MADELDLAEIEALAKAAGGLHGVWHVADEYPRLVFIHGRSICKVPDNGTVARAEKAHIARMDPATTLRLLALIAEKDTTIEAMKGEMTWRADHTRQLAKEIAEKDAEIERLKAWGKSMQEAWLGAEASASALAAKVRP